MISLSNYGETTAAAEAWQGVLPAVHINLQRPGEFLSLGYISITADNARVLAHQLVVAAERLEAAAAAAA